MEKRMPLTLAERTRRFRDRKRQRDGIAALAVARLVAGRPAGDGGRSLAHWLRDVAGGMDPDDERRGDIEDAADALERRRRP